MSQQELNSLLTVVRSLINSRKQPCSMYDILTDYSELENRYLPFTKFNFRNPYEFFKNTGEFVLHSYNNIIYVANIPNAKTAHVTKLVREQKTSKKSAGRLTKKLPSNRNYPKTPPPRFNNPPNRSNQLSRQGSFNQHQREAENKQQKLIDELKQRFEKDKFQLKETLKTDFNNDKKKLQRELEAKYEREIFEREKQLNLKLQRELEAKYKREVAEKEKQLNLKLQRELDAKYKREVAEKEKQLNLKLQRELEEKYEREVVEREKQINLLKKQIDELKSKPKPNVQQRLVVVKQNEEIVLNGIQNNICDNNNFIVEENEIVEIERVNAGLENLRKTLTKLNLDANNNNNNNKSNIMNNQQQQQQKTNSAQKMPTTTTTNAGKQSATNERVKSKGASSKTEQQTPAPPTSKQQQQKILRPILGQNTQNNYNNKNNEHKQQKLKPNLQVIIPNATKQTQQASSVSTSTPVQQKSQKPTFMPDSSINMQATSQQQQQQFVPKNRIQRVSSVQNRLKIHQLNDNDIDSNESEKLNTEQTVIAKEPPTLAPPSKPVVQKQNVKQQGIYNFDPNKDACISISEYCKFMNIPQPTYKVYGSKNGNFEGEITMENNMIFSTYPVKYPAEDIARQNAAIRAIKQIKKNQLVKSLPTFTEKEFLNILYKELLLTPNGVFSNKIEEWFAEKCGRQTPSNWLLYVKNSRRFTLEQGINEDTYIILANPNISIEEEIIVESAIQTMEPLKLPWSDKNWTLHVTHAVSTIEIWAYLLGDEYCQRFEILNERIQKHMINKKIRPDVIAAKHYYLVNKKNNWDRIRVQKIDKEIEKAFIFYIDLGYTEQIPLNELYFCDPEFLKLPPQAVPFSLFGLDDFAIFPNVDKILKENLLNQSFIAEIITKENELNENSTTIQIILFDTSTEEDINLNDLLQEKMCSSAKIPQLKEKSLTPVNITHVNEKNGDISLQINGFDMEYLKKMLKQIIESKLNREKHKCTINELLRKQLLLVHDNENDEWYRAKFISDDKQYINVLYIDYNIEKHVDISQIYRLESLSRALSKFPAQAICVKLHNIPEFSRNVIKRIRELLTGKCDEVLVRVMEAGAIPKVEISMRIKGIGMPFCNLNDDIRLEIERAKDATLYTRNGSDGLSSPSTPDSLTSPNQLFLRSPTLASEPMVPLKIKELPKLQEYNPLPKINGLLHVHVTVVSNPMSFTVQPYNEDYNRLLQMKKELQEYCNQNDVYIPADKVVIGQAYAAENGNEYFRVIAKSRYGEMINVSYCDYGDTGTVRIDHLKVLPMKFRQLPIMGINAKLYGIKGCSDGIWSSDDVKRFRELVLDKKLASYVKNIGYNALNSLELTLDLVDVSSDDDIYISKILLEENRVQAQE